MKTFTLRFLSALVLVSLLLGGQGARPAYAAGYTVNSLTDDNTSGDGLCTLREAIESANNAGNGDCGANSADDDTIAFGVSGIITLGSTLPNIVSGQGALTIDGGGNIIVSGNNLYRVMYVNSDANLTLQDLTIANGNVGSGDGGGVYNNGGTLTILNSVFSNNSAGYGGSVLNTNDGTLTITNSTFSGNSAGSGGGGVSNSGTLTVINSTFAGNNVVNGAGGGIANFGTLTVTNSTFSIDI